MRHAVVVQRQAWRSRPGRLALLGVLVLPVLAAGVLLLQPGGEALGTVDLPAVGAAPAAAAGRMPS